ncbi:MAG: pre-peptidase C-terminal domain-containing protein [Alphaproteobacteria bacterium]|nr:pre-peptidase C-terminal domain-containing protein [Alphaproteobacteria bacterium]MCB9796000.1 pre-peptidase C-terminal domain-containing protein [Alphaproteobacteria bacterium]
MTRTSFSLLLSIALLAAGCGEKEGDDSAADDSAVDDSAVDDSGADDSGEPATVESLSIGVSDDALYINESAGLMATAVLSDGSTQDVSPDVQWSVSDSSILSLALPEVLALAEGSAEVIASYEGASASATITVSALSLTGEVLLHDYPVGGVTLTLSGDAEGEATSDNSDGSFSFEGLGVGSYTVSVESNARGFEEGSEQLVELSGEVESLTFTVEEMGYPTADDLWEGDDAWGSASSIEVDGALQARALWPFGASDWIAVELTAGETYQLFTTGVCATCDTYLELYDSDGETYLDYSDDYLWLDSNLIYTAASTGTHYIRVRNYDEEAGEANYFLGALTFVDNDGDDAGAFHDCDDDDATVGPEMGETAGDGVDNDCDGLSRGDDTAEDANEPANDTIDGAVSLTRTTTAQETMHMGSIRAESQATLHDLDDVDWYAVTLPAYSQGYFEADRWLDDRYSYLLYTVYDTDGSTVLSSGSYTQSVANATSEEVTYYISVTIDTSRTEDTSYGYNLFFIDEGVDADQDGYSTRGWAYNNDCDDSDAEVTDGCYYSAN